MAAVRIEPDGEQGMQRAFLAGAREILAAGLAIRVTDFEFDEGSALTPLVDEVKSVVDRALVLLGGVTSFFDQPSPPSTTDDIDLFDEVERRLECEEGTDVRISGLAFIARGVLQSRRRELDVLTAEAKTWDVILGCSRATREVNKSFAALEIALCSLVGERPSDLYASEQLIAMRTRQAYVRFRADIADGMSRASPIALRLRFAGSVIAKLVGRPIYAMARVHDRWMIRRMQGQVRTYLNAVLRAGHVLTEDERLAGERLGQELINVSELMLQINHRAELQAHDLDRLLALERSVRAGEGPDARRALLAAVHGRSPDLDTLPEDAPAARWLEVLAVTRKALELQASTAPPPRRWTTPPSDSALDWSEL